MRSDRKNII